MPSDGKEARIAALKSAAIAKQERCAQNFDKAINKLVRDNEPITFANVAREAGISESYLYKIPEAKERVIELRAQQRQASKPNRPQTASDASKAVIIHELRERIKKLEAEIKDLRNINKGMAGKLYQLQEFESLVSRLRTENDRLKSQLADEIALRELSLTTQEGNPQHVFHQAEFDRSIASNSPDLTLVLAKPLPQQKPLDPSIVEPVVKVTALQQKRNIKSNVSDRIEQELASLGVKLNSTLSKVIRSAPESVVMNAIAALKEAITSGRIEHPGGWLKTAIESQWIPNEALEQPAKGANTSQPTFREWYDLAKAYGVIIAFEERDGVMMVRENAGVWHTHEDYVAKGWTIEYFRAWKSRRT
jgi:predicted transcriptional regulator